MTKFDGWDAPFCGDALALPRGQVSGDYLMHFRTKGSKNGIRRYQNEDGSWTPLGMRLRKEREGWGETRKVRKAERATKRAENKVRRAEKKVERTEKLAEKKAALREKTVRDKRRGDFENLSDAELKRKIERAKMEAEYKEITKSPLIKTGEKIVTTLIDNWGKKEERELAKARLALDKARIDADLKQAKERTEQAKYQTKQAKESTKQKAREVKRMKEDRKAGLKIERKAGLKRAQREYRESSFIGSFIKTHKEAKLARIENRKEIRKGTAFVKSLIKSQNKIDLHNFWNNKTKLNFNPESYKGEYQDKQNRYNWEQQTKQANAHAEQARYQAEAARWAYEKEKLGGKKSGGKGGKS